VGLEQIITTNTGIDVYGEPLLVMWWKNLMWISICPQRLIVKILDSILYELCLFRKYHKDREVRICTTLL
jgi:hypothetical protein